MRACLGKNGLLIGAVILLAALSALRTPAPKETEPAYRYLASGNSITQHPVCDYWWDETGMAATERGRDYVHLVADYLADKHGDVQTDIVPFSVWEITAKDRKDTYALIDPYLTEDVDWITVQLSENVASVRSLRPAYSELIRYIRDKCPQAQIVLVDDFWSDAKSRIKRDVARKTRLPFADLSGIRGDEAYQNRLGAMVYGADGLPHVIENEQVAKHPNDAGMAAIAQAVIDQLEKLP